MTKVDARGGFIGLPELEKALNELPDKVQERIIKGSMRAAAGVARNDAKRRVHVRTGDLKKAITVVTVTRKLQTRGWIGQAILGIKSPTSRRAHLEEFGTEHSDAHPFLRPAMEETKDAQFAAAKKKAVELFAKHAKKMAGPVNARLRRKGFLRKVTGG